MVTTMKQIKEESMREIRKDIKAELAGIRLYIRSDKNQNIRILVAGHLPKFENVVKDTVRKIVRRYHFRPILSEKKRAKRGEHKTAWIILNAA